MLDPQGFGNLEGLPLAIRTSFMDDKWKFKLLLKIMFNRGRPYFHFNNLSSSEASSPALNLIKLAANQ